MEGSASLKEFKGLLVRFHSPEKQPTPNEMSQYFNIGLGNYGKTLREPSLSRA